MSNFYNLLEGVLDVIEKNLREDINVDLIADKFDLSSRHLQRLFKLAFSQSIGLYIRSRKLAASIDDLLNTNLNVLSIALDYGFEYEQSYIRSFRREYGITPGDLRKTGKILKIKHPLQLFASNRYADGLIFGPDIVMVPKFHVIGKKYKIPLYDQSGLIPKIINQFIINDSKNTLNAINPDLIINIATEASEGSDYYFMMPSFQVKSLKYIPEGFEDYTFSTSLCARFSFINSDNKVINIPPTQEMFKTINNFMDNDNQKYSIDRNKITIDRLFLSNYIGNLKCWEWFSPVVRNA